MGAHIVFADESGFQLIPNVVQTWAPQGQTPIHRHRQGKREKISVISGISVSPKRHHLSLYYLLFLDNIGQEEVCLFLQEVLRHLRGPVIVLLDNSSTHQGAPLQKLLDQHPRLQVEHFPSYAPELNPDEGVWALAKREVNRTPLLALGPTVTTTLPVLTPLGTGTVILVLLQLV